MDINNKYQKIHPQKVVDVGYDVLMKNLGPVGTVQFMMSTFPGYGDSVEYYRELRQGKKVEDVIQEIKKTKKQNII